MVLEYAESQIDAIKIRRLEPSFRVLAAPSHVVCGVVIGLIRFEGVLTSLPQIGLSRKAGKPVETVEDIVSETRSRRK